MSLVSGGHVLWPSWSHFLPSGEGYIWRRTEIDPLKHGPGSLNQRAKPTYFMRLDEKNRRTYPLSAQTSV